MVSYFSFFFFFFKKKEAFPFQNAQHAELASADFLCMLPSRFYLLSLRSHPKKNNMDLAYILLFHTIVAAAIVLLASGASGLQSTKDQANPSKLNTDWRLAGVGGLLLTSAITLVFFGAMYTYLCYKPSDTQQRVAQRLVVAIAVACPLVAIRVIGSTAFYFSKNPDMNPINGSWGFRVGLYLVPEVLAASALVAGGLMSRNVRETSPAVSESGSKSGSRGS